jgi:PHD/YefM family antitoxin component YafN of YafNO toxin-antitoxin module
MAEIQYVCDEEGKPTAVLVPIDLWREIAAEKATAYLMSSEAMRRRLLEARERNEGISFEAARAELGV